MIARDAVEFSRALDEAIYRKEGLTIGGLAQHLRVPEYVLRRVINRGLGFRNFNDFLHTHRIREACDRHDVFLICDEVATGFGRTGTMFGCEQEQVTPDLLCVAKGLTGGYLPMAATLTTEKVFGAFLGKYEEFKTFFHGHSFTGNQLGAAASLAVACQVGDSVPEQLSAYALFVGALAEQRLVPLRELGLLPLEPLDELRERFLFGVRDRDGPEDQQGRRRDRGGAVDAEPDVHGESSGGPSARMFDPPAGRNGGGLTRAGAVAAAIWIVGAAASADTLEEIRARLDNGEQTIILLNRRGFSSFVACRSCGERIQCVNCAVTLTYHRRDQRLPHQPADDGALGRLDRGVDLLLGAARRVAHESRPVDVEDESAEAQGHALEDRRLEEVRRDVRAVLATGEDRGALGDGVLDVGQRGVELVLGDQRAHVDRPVLARAERHRLGARHEAAHEAVVDGVGDEHPLGRDAELAGVGVRRTDRALGGALDVGVLEDQDGVLATELERAVDQSLGTAGGDALAGRGRAGEADVVGALDDRGADLGARARDGDPEVLGEARLAEQLHADEGGEHGLAVGLGDDRVARHERREAVRHRHRERVVPRRDDADDALGHPVHLDLRQHRDDAHALGRRQVPLVGAGVVARGHRHVQRLVERVLA